MRNKSLDAAKGLGIWLVLIGHTAAYQNSELVKYIYAFHMPMFFLVSGFFYKERTLKEAVTIGFHRLIIPYFIIGFFCAVPSIAFGNTTSLHQFFSQVFGTIYSIPKSSWTFFCTPIWFLTCLFCTEAIYSLLGKLSHEIKALCVLALLLTGLSISKFANIYYPWNIHTACVAVFFYHVGTLLAKSTIYSPSASKPLHAAVFSIAALILVTSVQHAPDRVDMSAGIYGDMYFFMVTSLSGSIMVLSLSVPIQNVGLLSLFGRNTIILFGLNYWVLKLGNYYALDTYGWLGSFAIQIPVYFALALLSERNKLISTLLKRSPPNRKHITVPLS